MKPLRSREDLLALVAHNAPSDACARAIQEDRATVLGGFNPVEGFPSYVVCVRSKHGREWIIAILVNEPDHKYHVRYLDSVPWEVYIGVKGGGRPLIDGDKNG